MGDSLIAQLVMNLPAMQETLVQFLGLEDPWRGDRLPTTVFLGFPCGLASKESASFEGVLGSIPGLGRSPREEKGYPLQCYGQENSMDCIVHGVAKSCIQLSDSLYFILQMHHLKGDPQSARISFQGREK